MAQLPFEMIGFYLYGVYKTNEVLVSSLAEAIITEWDGKLFQRRSYSNYPISDVSALSEEWEVKELPIYTR